jgi:hypothetical protein
MRSLLAALATSAVLVPGHASAQGVNLTGSLCDMVRRLMREHGSQPKRRRLKTAA